MRDRMAPSTRRPCGPAKAGRYVPMVVSIVLFLFALAVPKAQAPAARPAPAASDWIQLFNGKSLEGWTPKFATQDLGVNYRNTFRVEDGLLKVRYDDWPSFAGEFGHLFYRDPFSYYR